MGIRTPDLLNAIEALYQLSYDPSCVRGSSKRLRLFASMFIVIFMQFKLPSAVVFACVASLALCSCNQETHVPQGDDDFETPTFKKAKEKYEVRDFKSSVELYDEVLRENPRMAKAHFELGLIYDEKMGDFVSAIYHYKRFLRIKPTGDNAKTVEQWIARAELQFATTQPNSPIQSADEIARLSKENLKLRGELDESARQIAKLERAVSQGEASVQEAQSKIQTLLATQQDQRNALAAAQQAAAAAATHPSTAVAPGTSNPLSSTTAGVTPFDVASSEPSSTAPTPVVLPEGARQHVVKSGDTVWKISAQYYPGKVKEGVNKIIEANKSSMPDPARLKLGQPLVIP